MTSIPSVNLTPWISFGNWLWPSIRRQFFWAPSTSLKTMASAVLFDRQPFDRIVRCRTVGGEVVERQQRIAVLGQAINRSLVFDLVGFDKGVECRKGILLGLGHPDLLQCALGLAVQALWHLVQDVGGLVHPAALLAGCRPHLAERLPEPERAIGNRNLRRRCQAATLQIKQQITPRLRALAHTIG